MIEVKILSVTQVIITYYNTNITKLCKQCKKVKSALCAGKSALCADFKTIFDIFLVFFGSFL